MRITSDYLYLKNHSIVPDTWLRLHGDIPIWQRPLVSFVNFAIFVLGLGGMLVTTLIAFTSAGFASRSNGSASGLVVASADFQHLLYLRL